MFPTWGADLWFRVSFSFFTRGDTTGTGGGKKVTIFSNDLGSAAYFVFRLRTGPRPKLAISNNTPKSDRIFNCKNVFAL
jgi:hypothetical protein